MDRVPMTTLGHQSLKAELHHLKTVVRLQVTHEIEVARAHGDLSENAEYHAAREKQSFVEGRIKEIESKLALAEIIEPSKLSGDRIVFGATVTLADAESGREMRYQIVGLDEADLKGGKISISSPFARALIGKSLGDEAVVRSPKGETSYEIVNIEFI